MDARFAWIGALALVLGGGCGGGVPEASEDAAGGAAKSATEGATEGPPNVLFLIVDDLRPELGAYGSPWAKTPNLDRLATEGVRFSRAYCQFAMCGPSRTAVLTGLRPDTTRVYGNSTSFREALPQATTLPQHFKRQGYRVLGLGKVFHGGLDDRRSWSEAAWRPEGSPWIGYATALNQERGGKGPPIEVADVEDAAYPDGELAERAIETLEGLGDEPFFLAVGFYKPHLPFAAPRRYWDLHDRRALPTHLGEPADGAPAMAFGNWEELRGYQGMPAEGPLSAAAAKQLVHGYFASVSFVDAQIGKVLEALERFGLAENTVVVLWGDHGWHLGEQGLWCKNTNFEAATRAPLIVRWRGAERGAEAAGLVELIDLFPTLCELAGLPAPAQLEGASFAAQLRDPTAPGKEVAYSQCRRGRWEGHSVRTEELRLTRWTQPGEEPVYELYDHESDPGERRNLAASEAGRAQIEALEPALDAR